MDIPHVFSIVTSPGCCLSAGGANRVMPEQESCASPSWTAGSPLWDWNMAKPATESAVILLSLAAKSSVTLDSAVWSWESTSTCVSPMHMRLSSIPPPPSLGTMLNTTPCWDCESNLIAGSLSASIRSWRPTDWTTCGATLADLYHLPDCASNLPLGFIDMPRRSPSRLPLDRFFAPMPVSLSMTNKRASSSCGDALTHPSNSDSSLWFDLEPLRPAPICFSSMRKARSGCVHSSAVILSSV
mmetsp:Transcript_68765/g.111585  ORF Transcript_68765/g.111585 Transcript_68765/m.111585 type:complete len:242 (+) Transcript_68765:830-1555(+)